MCIIKGFVTGKMCWQSFVGDGERCAGHGVCGHIS